MNDKWCWFLFFKIISAFSCIGFVKIICEDSHYKNVIMKSIGNLKGHKEKKKTEKKQLHF